MKEKQLITEVISNYEELKRISRKTEYEIYIGGLKSKLDLLYFRKTIMDSIGIISLPILRASFPPTNSFKREIDELEQEIENAEITIRVSENITDRLINIFKIYLNSKYDLDFQNEIAEANKLITENVLQILEKSIKYKFYIIENQIRKGRIYLAQMKDSERDYDTLKKELESIQKETDLNLRKIRLEEVFDRTLNVIYDANLSIKDSKWLRIITYITFLIAIMGVIITLNPFHIFKI